MEFLNSKKEKELQIVKENAILVFNDGKIQEMSIEKLLDLNLTIKNKQYKEDYSQLLSIMTSKNITSFEEPWFLKNHNVHFVIQKHFIEDLILVSRKLSA